MCFDCDKEKITSISSFAKGEVGSKAKRQQEQKKALDDPTILHEAVIFKNGADIIDGYLARPKAAGQYRAVVILHGNAGLPEDIRNTAAQVAQAGFVGLAVSCTSREPDPSQIPGDFLRSNSFNLVINITNF
jgi:hypothetical protein